MKDRTVSHLTWAVRFALVPASLLLIPRQLSAHLGNRVFPIYELSTADLPDLHDGTLEDWEEVLPNASLNHNDFKFDDIGVGGRIDPSDLAVNVYLAWHSASQQICVAVERLDDVYFSNESIGFKVDGDHSGGQFIFVGDAYSGEESLRRSFAQAQAYAVYADSPWGDSRPVVVAPNMTWITERPWADAGGWQFGESPNYSAVEFCVTPWDNLVYDDVDLSRRSTLQPGGHIGFELSTADSDEFNRLDGTYTLAIPTMTTSVNEGNSSYRHDGFAENFVDGELIPCFHGDCSGLGTAVRRDSWGMIKAATK